jgi:hypothetical protein
VRRAAGPRRPCTGPPRTAGTRGLCVPPRTRSPAPMTTPQLTASVPGTPRTLRCLLRPWLPSSGPQGTGCIPDCRWRISRYLWRIVGTTARNGQEQVMFPCLICQGRQGSKAFVPGHRMHARIHVVKRVSETKTHAPRACIPWHAHAFRRRLVHAVLRAHGAVLRAPTPFDQRIFARQTIRAPTSWPAFTRRQILGAFGGAVELRARQACFVGDRAALVGIGVARALCAVPWARKRLVRPFWARLALPARPKVAGPA